MYRHSLASSFLVWLIAVSMLPAAQANEEPRQAYVLLFDTAHTLEVADSASILPVSHFAPQAPDHRSPALPEFTPPGEGWLPEEAPDEEHPGLVADASRYEASLQTLESNGAWDDSLAQELLSLGAVQQRLGEHLQAIETFDRATHLTRVNRGLYSLQQMPAVESRIASFLALGDWEEADRLQQYAFHVHTRALESDDPALIPALERLASWHLTAFFRALDEFPPDRLFDAYTLYEKALVLSTRSPERDIQREIEYLNQMVGVAYLVARTSSRQYSGLPSASRNGDMARLANSDARISRNELHRANGYGQGEAALERIISLHEQLPQQDESMVLDRAEAIARLGDWYVLFDRRRSATEAYERAWQLLAAHDPQQAEAFFARVPVLPQFPTFSDERRLAVHEVIPENMQAGYVDVRLAVNQHGRARNIEVVDRLPADKEQVSARLARDLRTTRLRPRVVDGETVDTDRVSLRFPYWY